MCDIMLLLSWWLFPLTKGIDFCWAEVERILVLQWSISVSGEFVLLLRYLCTWAMNYFEGKVFAHNKWILLSYLDTLIVIVSSMKCFPMRTCYWTFSLVLLLKIKSIGYQILHIYFCFIAHSIKYFIWKDSNTVLKACSYNDNIFLNWNLRQHVKISG